MRGHVVIGALGLALLLIPAEAAGDFLYSPIAASSEAEPRVLLIADASGSMAWQDVRNSTLSRMDSARAVLRELIPAVDGSVTLGLTTYGRVLARDPRNQCAVLLEDPDACCRLPASEADRPATREELLALVERMAPDGMTPIAHSLDQARLHIQAVRAGDEAAICRRYAVVLLTDGLPSCNEGPSDALQAVRRLRQAGVDVYVVGFGADVTQNNQNGAETLAAMAREAGTARLPDGSWCSPGPGGTCSEGMALFATDAEELASALVAAFDRIRTGLFSAAPPVIATVPQEASEVNRVARNFLAAPAFELPGNRGHLFGIRLFVEDAEREGSWVFTDFRRLDLRTCGAEGNPCLFDAGALLAARERPRRILLATPEESFASAPGGLTLRLAAPLELEPGGASVLARAMAAVVDGAGPLAPGVAALPEATRQRLQGLAAGDDAALRAVVDWVHGRSRAWPLGDVLHAAPTVVAAPPYPYRSHGYPRFRVNLRNRPAMVYVGANDGMIHAFHAAPDLEGSPPRWQAGEEAWAYLPFNQLAKVSLAALAGAERVDTQDLACQVDDVLVEPAAVEAGSLDCAGDPRCGWRTILICGQGWGGSWYVAIDVTDPLAPRPLWESTVPAVIREGQPEPWGLGRTWSLPSIALLRVDRLPGTRRAWPGEGPIPLWAAVYGSGYNADMRDAEGHASPAYRLLNLPFAGDGRFGDGTRGESPHVFVQDLASGEYLHVFHHHPGGEGGGRPDLEAIVADIPLADVDRDGFTDVGYVGGFSGAIDRIAFPAEGGVSDPAKWSNACSDLLGSGGPPIVSRPVLLVDPVQTDGLLLFSAAGIEPGPGPEQASGVDPVLRGDRFADRGGSACPERLGPLCTADDDEAVRLQDLLPPGNRIRGAPILALQPGQRRWLTFTSWREERSACGVASWLHCLDVTDARRCVPCGDLVGDSAREASGQVGPGTTTTPVTADGELYLLQPGSVSRVGNESGTEPGIDGSPPSPNPNPPRRRVVSWREIF